MLGFDFESISFQTLQNNIFVFFNADHSIRVRVCHLHPNLHIIMCDFDILHPHLSVCLFDQEEYLLMVNYLFLLRSVPKLRYHLCRIFWKVYALHLASLPLFFRIPLSFFMGNAFSRASWPLHHSNFIIRGTDMIVAYFKL